MATRRFLGSVSLALILAASIIQAQNRPDRGRGDERGR